MVKMYKTKPNTIFIAGMLSIILCFTSVFILMKSFSRFLARDMGNDSARVATYVASINCTTSDDNKLISGREWSEAVEVVIKNKAEVKSEYTITVDMLPEKAEVQLLDENFVKVSENLTVDEGDSKVTFEKNIENNPFTFPYSTEELSKTYNLKIFYPAQKDEKDKPVEVYTTFKQVK